MRGDPSVIEILNEVLTSELTAINQYYVHYKMCENWGYARVAAKKREESIEEMKHADRVIARILYLDGIPNMQRLSPVRVGEDVQEQHRLDLEIEIEAVDRLNRGVALCRDKGDNGTRELLAALLVEEEESVDWLEAQLGIISTIGLEAYLAEQLH
ncbi:MAG: bacterioferritin [Planctomycetota bacterium]